MKFSSPQQKNSVDRLCTSVQVLNISQFESWYKACDFAVAVQRNGGTMKKTTSIISMSLLAASLIVPSVRAYADDDNPPGNHRQREALRHDQRELQELRDRRHDELREGDKREAREYQDKIRDKRNEIRNDRREIYGNDHDRRYGWDRDGRHDRDHDQD
jgi:hypothetical protein